jgi:hypothetical protein
MKKALIPSILTSLTIIICACQKQDSAAQQQLAQQKAQEEALDRRMNALDEKVNRLSATVKALAQQERSTADAQTAPREPQPRDVMRDVEQMKALMANPALRSSVTAEKDRLTQERRAQTQAGLGQLQNPKISKSKISGTGIPPGLENSPAPSPDTDHPSPTEPPASP